MANRTGGTILVTGAMRMRRIFDHHELMSVRDRHDQIHISRLACKMNGDDCAGARRDCGFDGHWINVEGLKVDVREHRDCVCLHHCRRSRKKCVGRNDHLVFRLNSRSDQRDSQRNCSVHHCNPMLAAMHRRKVSFKFRDLSPVQPAPFPAAQYFQETFLFLLTENRPRCERPRANRPEFFRWHSNWFFPPSRLNGEMAGVRGVSSL